VNGIARLGLYGAGLAALFSAAFLVAGAVVPESTVAAWSQKEEEGDSMQQHSTESTATPVRGLALEQDGVVLSAVSAPDTVDEAGTLSFQIATADGDPVTAFEMAHDKELHLIVVRSDGAMFQHVHPTMASDGTWSTAWTWDAAGSYRVFADFVPIATGEDITLTRTIDVAGNLAPDPATEASSVDTVDGYTVTLTGELSTSTNSTLTAAVTRDGQPVTELEPYLAAYGHLVALREGDLAYLHVHPEGDEPAEGSTSGPDIQFMTQAPISGRYLLYLDFKAGGNVHTAHFVLDATTTPTTSDTGHSGH
jgi:hypothetical protein